MSTSVYSLINDKPRKFKIEIRQTHIQTIELDHEDLLSMYQQMEDADPDNARKLRRVLDTTFLQLSERETPIIIDRGSYTEQIDEREFWDYWCEYATEALEKIYKKLKTAVDALTADA
jgi:hypothetical protein